MDKHYLDNMIFNLEDKKDLKEVIFTKQAVEEILYYLKILQSYEDRTNHLEKMLSDYVDSNIKFYENTKSFYEKQNKILEKALKISCKTIKEIMTDKPTYICGDIIADKLNIPIMSEIKDYDYFIEQAKEILKDE